MSLLIKGVQVVDGAGKPPYRADVLVQNDVISAIGELKNRRAKKEIDGLGHYLTPGFIDVNNHLDHYLAIFDKERVEQILSYGVTTIIGGQCGSSLAPLLYGTLESIRKWTLPEEVNVNWHTLAEFFKSLEKLPLRINLGTLVGHSTIRRALIGEENRKLSQRELVVFRRILQQAMQEGAFGLSTGLGYIHGLQANPWELKGLADVAEDFDGIYATHLRNDEEKLLASIEETIKIARETKVKTIISHLKPVKGFEDEFERAILKIEKVAAWASIHFDLSPSEVSALEIYRLLPQWAQVANLETMLEELNDETKVRRIKKAWQGINFDELSVAVAPENQYLVGKTLAEIADNLDKEPSEALIYLMKATKMRAMIFNHNINSEFLAPALAHKRSFIGSNGHLIPSVNIFSKYFDIVLSNKLLSLESAVQKITSLPANYFGIKNRGVIKEGKIADLVILDKNDYQVKQVILGGKVMGEEELRGGVLRHKKD